MIFQQVEIFESKMESVNAQLHRQYDVQRSAESRSKRVESDYFEIKERLRRMDDEIAATDALREGLRMDKEKVLKMFGDHMVYCLKKHYKIKQKMSDI